MKLPNAAALLQAWETNQDAHLIRRALALLDAAWPEVGVTEWSRVAIGERDARLLQLREMLFGTQLQTVAQCPRCNERLESVFTTQSIRVQRPDSSELPGDFHGHFQLRNQDCNVEYRLPNSEDLLTVAETGDAAAASAELLRRCVVVATRADAPVDPVRLPESVVAMLGADMQQRDPGADIRIGLSCPLCQHAWTVCFDIVSYLWSEIEDWAQRLLSDIHLLAQAYGWSEGEILALTPTRRRIYLDMVCA